MKFTGFLQQLYCRFQDDEVPAVGAQLTYYLILAFFPFLVFVIAVLGFTDLTADDAISGLAVILPELSQKTVIDVFHGIQQSRSGPLLSIGLLAALWSASNGIGAVIKALNKAYDAEEDRPFWKVKGLSVLSTVIMALVIVCCFGLLIFGRIIGEALYRFFRLPGSFDTLWGTAQVIIPLTVIAVVFIMLYSYVPNLRLSFKEVVPGAVFATIGWVTASLLFSFYVNHFGSYTKTYGSIGGIIVLLIWLYLSAIILILGGEINAILHFGRQGLEKPPCKRYSLRLPFGRKKDKDTGRFA